MCAASNDGDGNGNGDGCCVVVDGCDVKRSKGRYEVVMVIVMVNSS